MGAFSQGLAAGLVGSNGDIEDGLISGVTAVGFNSLHSWDVKGANLGHKALKATAHGVVGGLSSVAVGVELRRVSTASIVSALVEAGSRG